jgi:hypothetical protein
MQGLLKNIESKRKMYAKQFEFLEMQNLIFAACYSDIFM